MERQLTVEFGPSRSKRFGKALAEAENGPSECSELEPGRYRASFVLGSDAAAYTALARLLERVRHWRASEVCEGDEPASAYHAKEMAWCASSQLKSFGECRFRFSYGIFPRCSKMAAFDVAESATSATSATSRRKPAPNAGSRRSGVRQSPPPHGAARRHMAEAAARIPPGGRMKAEVVTENEDGTKVEKWSGPGAYEAALALVGEDWDVLAVPAEVAGAERRLPPSSGRWLRPCSEEQAARALEGGSRRRGASKGPAAILQDRTPGIAHDERHERRHRTPSQRRQSPREPPRREGVPHRDDGVRGLDIYVEFGFAECALKRIDALEKMIRTARLRSSSALSSLQRA